MGKLVNIIKEARNRINIYSAGDITDYKKLVNNFTKDRNERAKYIADFNFYKSKIDKDLIKSEELKNYIYNIIKTTENDLKNNQNEYLIYLPMYSLTGWYYSDNLVYSIIKSLHTHDYVAKDEFGTTKVRTIKEGEYMAISCDQFGYNTSNQLIIYDKNNKEVITKHTELKIKEVEKTIEKTKIVKQEVKAKLDWKKVEKAKQKTLHKFKDEKWAKNEEVLNDFINQLM